MNFVPINEKIQLTERRGPILGMFALLPAILHPVILLFFGHSAPSTIHMSFGNIGALRANSILISCRKAIFSSFGRECLTHL